MPNLHCLAFLLPLLLTALPAGAAEAAKTDDDFIKLCAGELEDRLFGEAAHEHAFIVSSTVKHEAGAGRAAVALELASGEGRRIGGVCRFRDGKLFDVQ